MRKYRVYLENHVFHEMVVDARNGEEARKIAKESAPSVAELSAREELQTSAIGWDAYEVRDEIAAVGAEPPL
jgi:hypothetical protein